MKSRHVLAVLLMVAFLSACAQTGQSLRLSPEPPATGPAVGLATEVGLRVVDTREQTATLGTQQTIQGEVFPLTASQALPYVVQLAAAEALRGYDLKASLWADNQTPRIEIQIDQLQHEVRAGIPWQLDTEITLRAVAFANGERLTTRAQTTLNNQRATPPNATANAVIIDEAITRALGQLLNEELARFLAGEM